MTTATVIQPDLTLVAAFKAARQAADTAGFNAEDGGTCNLDSPAFRLKGASEAKLRASAQAAGIGVSPFTWFGGRRWFWLTGVTLGQGNRRARMSAAATKALKAAHVPGLEVCEYCQMD
jgi:hypothetical protein